MKLKSKLPSGSQIFLGNSDGQTRISLESSGEGSNQSQANSFSTGQWKGQPTLFKTPDGLVLQLEAEQGSFSFGIQGSSIQQLNQAPSTEGAQKLDLEEASEDEGGKPMKPMKPMEPMKGMEPMKPMS